MVSPSPLVLATGNPGKVSELQSLLADLPVTLIAASELEDVPEVTEDSDTLEGNALKKAHAFHDETGFPALADDTGLEVDTLGGAPGVHTARFAGPHATPDDNKRHLLDVLKGAKNRSARFRTVVAFVDADGMEHTFEGTCAGVIATEERGDGGFGYDPLFLPDGHDETFAEMSPAAKNKISHRARALDAAHNYLRRHFGTGN